MRHGFYSEYAEGRYAVGENDWLLYPKRALNFSNRPVQAIILGHGYGATADYMSNHAIYHTWAMNMSKRYLVAITDLGGTTFGNAAGRSSISTVRAWLSMRFNIKPKIGLVAVSMGGSTTLSYALANPSNVAFWAGVIPALSLNSLRSTFSASVIDSCYSGGYTDAAYGAASSPDVFKNSFPLDSSIPQSLYYASDDPICVPYYPPLFAGTTGADITVMPNVGHSEAAQHLGLNGTTGAYTTSDGVVRTIPEPVTTWIHRLERTGRI